MGGKGGKETWVGVVVVVVGESVGGRRWIQKDFSLSFVTGRAGGGGGRLGLEIVRQRVFTGSWSEPASCDTVSRTAAASWQKQLIFSS